MVLFSIHHDVAWQLTRSKAKSLKRDSEKVFAFMCTWFPDLIYSSQVQETHPSRRNNGRGDLFILQEKSVNVFSIVYMLLKKYLVKNGKMFVASDLSRHQLLLAWL